MLENLTKKLVEDDWASKDTDMLLEGAAIITNMSQIERYSCIEESVEFDTVMDVLDRVNIDRTSLSFEEGCGRLYEACVNPSIIEEAIGVAESDNVKRLSMTKEDYDKIVSHVKEYVLADTDEEKLPHKKKMKSFVGTINANIVKADEVDTFIAGAIRKIYNALRSDRPLSGTSKAVIMSNIRGIKDALK